MLRYNRKNKNLKIPVGIGTNNNVDSSLLFNVSDGDATAGDLIAGKTAYSAEGFLVGTLDLEGEKTSSYNEGYANGNEVGYNNGYNTGNEVGYNNGYVQGEQDGYVSGEADGYADGYAEGKEDGIEEILTEQSDANITPGDVLEGYIGYGANNERIVGTNVGGYDFMSLGYTEEENADANRRINLYKFIPENVLNSWDVTTTNASNKFSGSNLVLCPKINTSNVTNMNQMFIRSIGLIYVPSLDTHNVTSMTDMFNGCKSLLYAPSLDTHNVTNMGNMFYDCNNLQEVPQLDYSNVTSMTGMFKNCGQMSGTFDVSYSNKIENLSDTFAYCKKIEHININAENLITCNNMINSCEGLKSLKITNISSKCTDLEYKTTSLTPLDFEYFEISGDTTNVKPYSGYAPSLLPISRKLRTVIIDIDTHFLRKTSTMFYNCELLENIPFFNTSNVTHMGGMFYGCSSLKTIPLLDTSNVTNMYEMFKGCTSLETIPLLNTSNVTSMGDMFDNCPELKSLPLLDFGSVLDPRNIFASIYLASREYKLLTDLAGFKDLGKSMNKSYVIDWHNLVALTRQSVVNIFNNLYDLTTTIQYARITLAPNVKALLSDEDFAIATNKGWIIQ